MVKKIGSVLMSIALASIVSSCGVAKIHSVHEGEEITQEELMKTPIGTSQETILARFGEPSRTTYMTIDNKKENVWFYCWKRGTSGSVLFGLVGGSSAKAKCATFVFKNGKLVSKGIGRGSNASLTPTIKIQKTEIIKKEEGDKGLNN